MAAASVEPLNLAAVSAHRAGTASPARRRFRRLRRVTPTPPAPPRRLVILAEGNFGFHHGKTAVGVIRYGPDDVVAVIDSTQAGGNVSAILPGHDIPIVASLGGGPRADGRRRTRC